MFGALINIQSFFELMPIYRNLRGCSVASVLAACVCRAIKAIEPI